MFAKFDLKIFHPSLLEHEIWHYNKANTDLICRSIHEVSWEKKFPIQIQIKKCIYLMKQLRIFSLILYHTRQLFVMITIAHASTAKLKI